MTSGGSKGCDINKFEVGVVFGMLPVVPIFSPSSVKIHQLSRGGVQFEKTE